MATLRRHWPFAIVLGLGALLRIACEVAYRPALFYSDSWGYLSMAHGSGIVSFAPLRPSGYPLILKVLHALPVITVAQHLAGLVTAMLVYATCRATGVRRWLATAAGALVALDAWAIALEQYVLAEAFFALALMLAIWLSLAAAMRREVVDTGTNGDTPTPGNSSWLPSVRMRPRATAALPLGLAGLCIAGAALMRPVALFAVPAWVIWLIWVRPGIRPLAAALACLIVPLVVYSAAHAHTTGTFGLTQANGWFLYGRIGPIASCDGIDVQPAARKLCKQPPQAKHENQSFFMFNRRSPARRAFGGISANSHKQAHSNAVLGHFARQVILHRPLDYANLVATDFFKYFRPGPHALHREDLTVEFPRSARIRFDDREIRHRLYPGLRVHASSPASALRSYAKVVHTSRPLIALLSLLALGTLIAGLWLRDPRLPALFLAFGVGIGVLLGAAAAAGFALRYLVPVVPAIALAGALAIEIVASLGMRRALRRS